MPSTILPDDLTRHKQTKDAGIEGPPEGMYSPFFSPEKSLGSSAQKSQRSSGGWDVEGVSGSSLGATPSEIAGVDAEEEEEEEGYDDLMRRVQEALGIADEEGVDAEVDLLQKVQEALECTVIDGNRSRVDASRFSRRESQEFENVLPPLGARERASVLVNGCGEESHRISTDKREQNSRTRHSERASISTSRDYHCREESPNHTTAMPLPIDFSLADGTYACDMTTSQHGKPDKTGKGVPARHNQPPEIANPYSKATMHVSRPHSRATAKDSTGIAHQQRNPIGGMIGSTSASIPIAATAQSVSITVPRIVYESFVADEDTFVERALAPLMAKYVPDTSLPSTETHHPTNNFTRARQSRPPSTRTSPPPPSSTDTTATTFTLNTSTTFTDQLSLASLEYMKRHALVGGGQSQSQSGMHQQRRAKEFGGRRTGVEGVTKILDVERIRRLPKLGMPK